MILKVQFLLHENQLLAKDNWFCGLRVRVRVGRLHCHFRQSFIQILLTQSFQAVPPGGGDSYMKQTGMLVVSLRGVNFGFWSRLRCSGQSANILSRQGLV